MGLQPLQQSLRKFYPIPAKGLNERFDPTVLKDDEAAELINLQVNQDGTLSKYPGYIKDGSPFPNASASFIRMLHNLKRGSSVDTLLIAALDAGNANATYKVDIKSTIGDGTYSYIGHTRHTATITNGSTAVTGTSTTWTTELKAGDKIKATADPDTSYKEIATVNSDTSLTLVGNYSGTGVSSGSYIARKIWDKNNVPRAVTFDNFAVITNGIDTPQLWDNTSLDSITDTDAPKAHYLEVYKNRLFMANTSTNPSRLFWSAANDPTTWDPVSTEDVAVQDGGDIVSIKSFSGSLIVFKSNGTLYQVVGNFDQDAQGSPDFIRKLDIWENIGAIAERSPIVHNNALYFVSETGVYRVDPRMFIEKVSYVLDPFISSINFALTGNQNKAFAFATKAQWDTGTESGFWADSNGTLHSFFDDFRITDANKGPDQCSIAIGTDNTIHIAYNPTSGAHTFHSSIGNTLGQKITYVRYKPDGTKLSEDTGVSGFDIQAISIAVSPVDQTVGIGYVTVDDPSGNFNIRFVERTPDSGSTLGTWGAAVDTSITGGGDPRNHAPRTLACLYNSAGNPVIATAGVASGAGNIGYMLRTTGSWSYTNTVGSSNSLANTGAVAICLDNSDNPYIVGVAWSTNSIYAEKNTLGSWVSIEDFNPNPHSFSYQSSLACYLDNSTHFHSIYSNINGVTIDRDHTAGTTKTVDSATNSFSRGGFYIRQSILIPPSVTQYNAFYYYTTPGINSAGTAEQYFYEASSEYTNPTFNVIDNPNLPTVSNTIQRPCGNAYTHNGQTTASVAFGQNTNEIVIRRITFFGRYLTPIESDNTLTAWGTYNITNQITNGNSVVHYVGVASTSPPTVNALITNGQTISSNASLIFVQAAIFFTIAGVTWAGMSVDSVVLNYIGAGADAKQVVGQEFFNELYYAVCETGNTANNKVLVYDIAEAPLKTTYAVNAMARFKTKLYAGSSTNGDLYILKQGYDFNGSSYSSDFQSREDFLEFIDRDKEIHKVLIAFKNQPSGTFTFSYRFNNFLTTGGTSWNTVSIDQTGTEVFAVPELAGKLFRSVQFRIQDSNTGVPISLLGISLLYSVVGMRP